MGEKYTYQHPDGKGLGAHHADPADPELHERPAQPEQTVNSMRGAAGIMAPTEEQQQRLEEFLGRTMHDLDLPHGQEVEHTGTGEEDGLHRLEWTDQHGNPRAIAVTDELLAEHFTPKGASA